MILMGSVKARQDKACMCMYVYACVLYTESFKIKICGYFVESHGEVALDLNDRITSV